MSLVLKLIGPVVFSFPSKRKEIHVVPVLDLMNGDGHGVFSLMASQALQKYITAMKGS